MSTNCPGCGAELVVGLERTEEDRLREVVRSELAMQPPVVVHETVEVPVVEPEPDVSPEAIEDAVEDAVEDLEEAVEDLEDEIADDASDEIADELADELAVLDEPAPEPEAPAPADDEPRRGHFLGRKVFG